mgnify:CR=1 FL=1
MKTIIAEKPSVAREIARIVGATKREEGYFEGGGYAVTWAFGHLVQLAMPDGYGVRGFVRDNLPIIPDTFTLVPRQVRTEKGYKPDSGVVSQIKVIKRLFDTSEHIIVATDAGREGELIFRYLYHYTGCTTPFVRLWISSLTDKAIREGLRKLEDGSKYDNLYLAAKARSESDWLVGINGTQALSIAAGHGTYSVGRVQTPTLAMVCERYWENRRFTSEAFWQLHIATDGCDGEVVKFSSSEKWKEKEPAMELYNKVKAAGCATVTKAERKEKTEETPLLYDLTALQKEANGRYGFSADKTLSVAQSLYEKKVLSYPRTGSRYLSDDVFDEIPDRIALLERYPAFAAHAAALKGASLNRRSVDAGKVTDHHALIITECLPGELSADERTVYDMVAARLLEAFSPHCVKEMTEVALSAGGEIFTLKGAVVKSAGWRAVRGEPEEEVEEATLPELQTDETLPLLASETVEKQTKPKPLHTESSLLSAMEHCGREIGDGQLRTAIREAGIGTPATRAAVIETLFSRNYIRRDKKNLVPTEKGLAVYDTVKDKKIADVEMTAAWEDTLAKIETGEADAPSFRRDIEVYTAQIVAELLSATLDVAPSGEQCTCPKCKKSRILFFDKVAKCADVDCGFTLFRNKGGKVLTDKQIVGLVTTGRTPLVKGFRNREGRSFDAALVLNPDFTVGYSFPDRKPQGEKSGRKR